MNVRLVFTLIAALLTAQCASAGDEDSQGRFLPGRSAAAMVVLGLAEAEDSTHPDYAMLWRSIDADSGQFAEPGGRREIEVRSNERGAARAPGLPGEFFAVEVQPGMYALDSVFATISDGRVVYIAQGLIEGPERPAFTVGAGEAIYIGIWEASLESGRAAVRPWRLIEADMHAAARELDAVAGEISLRETYVQAVPCSPRRLTSRSQRQIC